MTDRPQLRSGIIGTGFIGTVHARAVLANGGHLSAVTAGDPGHSRRAAGRLGADKPASADEIISDDDIDVIHICTPNSSHVDLALRALAAGKHVICEKPLAVTQEGAEKLAHAAEEAGAIAVVPFVYRFYPTVREARARVSTGNTGPLRLLHGSYLQDWMASPDAIQSWRTRPSLGGPSRAFADIGIHWCDLAEFVTGHHISRLSARTLRVRDHGHGGEPNEDIATVVFETAEGALGSVVISQVARGRKNRLWFSFDGDEASVSFNQENPEWLWVGSEAGNLTIPRGDAGMSQEALRLSLLPVGHPQGFQDCFNALVADTYAAIAGEVPDGLPTFADGYRSAVLTEAFIRSAESGTWMEVG